LPPWNVISTAIDKIPNEKLASKNRSTYVTIMSTHGYP
jgi:hypothetical protein